MKTTLSILSILLFLFACSQPATDQKNHDYLDEEIAQLDTDEKLQAYWEAIGKLDQAVRSEETFELQKYGHDSKEHKAAWQKIMETDELNLTKAEKLFAKFGFPKNEVLGPKAATAAFLVIHHTPTYEAKERNFHYLYGAYQNGHLKEGPFSFYLNRMYETKMGKRYEVGAVFNEEDRIKGIIGELGLLK